MNPHFLYNALNSIQDLILQQDIRATNKYLSMFSQLVRNILDASRHEFTSVAEELKLLQHYLELEKLRFDNDFSYEMKVDSSVDPDTLYVPSIFIQPYVENAIKHGLFHSKKEKELRIHFAVKDDQLHCTIADNGIGRERAQQMRANSVHNSFATSATQRRLELLQAQYKHAFSLTITDEYREGQPVGTTVHIVFSTRLRPS
jgi:sensor histidine kinase YesM